jgi:hypothetical protein
MIVPLFLAAVTVSFHIITTCCELVIYVSPTFTDGIDQKDPPEFISAVTQGFIKLKVPVVAADHTVGVTSPIDA